MSIDAADRLAIHELLALYGHLLDERRWSDLDQVFVLDVVFDSTDFGFGVMQGVDGIVEAWRDAEHPIAHHTTNVVIREDGDVVRVVSKHIGVRAQGWVLSATYRDVVRRTPVGWRIAERVALRRGPAPAAL